MAYEIKNLGWDKDGGQSKLSQGMTEGNNLKFDGLDYRASRDPQGYLHLFNISERAFKQVGIIKLNVLGLNDVNPNNAKDKPAVLEGDTEEKQPYRYITSFPQPMLFPKENIETNKIEFVEEDVRVFVINLIRPDATSSNLDAPLSPNAISQGNDLSRAGLFYDFTEVPSKEALGKAYARLEVYYNALLGKLRTLSVTDKVELQSLLHDNPDCVFAVKYFGKEDEFEWAQKQSRPVVCSVCGEKKRAAGVKVHQTQDGYLCIEPTVEGWKMAVNTGRKSKSEVPEDFQWWAVKKVEDFIE